MSDAYSPQSPTLLQRHSSEFEASDHRKKSTAVARKLYRLLPDKNTSAQTSFATVHSVSVHGDSAGLKPTRAVFLADGSSTLSVCCVELATHAALTYEAVSSSKSEPLCYLFFSWCHDQR